MHYRPDDAIGRLNPCSGADSWEPKNYSAPCCRNFLPTMLSHVSSKGKYFTLHFEVSLEYEEKNLIGAFSGGVE